MDRWEAIRRAAADTRSGSLAVTARATQGMRRLTNKRDVLRAARVLLRAHPAMGALWRLVAVAYEADEIEQAVDRFQDTLESGTAAAADSVRWVARRRRTIVVTCSASGTVLAALGRIANRVEEIRCSVSLPGGEGRRFARRLAAAGFRAEVFADAAVARACEGADLAFVGADAVTEAGVVNKIGTYPLALAAAEAGVGCYALAPTAKFIPASVVPGVDAYETTPLHLFDSVLTERGPRRPAAIRRAVEAVAIPRAVERIKT